MNITKRSGMSAPIEKKFRNKLPDIALVCAGHPHIVKLNEFISRDLLRFSQASHLQNGPNYEEHEENSENRLERWIFRAIHQWRTQRKASCCF